jgi:3-deoxy-D-manno-octulosonic-acid transferase
MRAFYSFLFYLLSPFILLRLLWRSLKAPSYRLRWAERFGFYRRVIRPVDIWVHAVSVGETEAVFPLIKKIQHLHPNAKVLVTSTTPTGSARIQAVLSDSVSHCYLPYDLPGTVARFLRYFQPKLGIVMETEIWPNLFNACNTRHIPLFLLNARLSEKSARGYRKIPALIQPALQTVRLIAAQTEQDAQRFINAGACSKQIKVFGNIKFDLAISDAVLAQGHKLKQQDFFGRFVWLIASTHKGEEAFFLEMFSAVKARIPELLLVLVPRHPERFEEVKKLCGQHHCQVVRRTSPLPVSYATDVYLADTLGELKMLYAAADIAFVGGSLVPVGGHNVLEAAAAGTPVMFGPYMHNFQDIAAAMLKQEAAIQCTDRSSIFAAVTKLYQQPLYRNTLRNRGIQFVKRNQGTLNALYDELKPLLPN